MRVVRYLVLGVLLAGLVVTSVGWYRAADAGGERTFESCRFDSDTPVLSYTYGVNEIVSPSLDTTGADIVVALRVKRGDGSAVMIGLTGEARFAIYGEDRTVRYPGGEVLTCTGWPTPARRSDLGRPAPSTRLCADGLREGTSGDCAG